MSNPYERINDIVFNLQNKRYNSALTLIVTLIDRSAKDLYSIKKVGERFKKLINENLDFILSFGSGTHVDIDGQFMIRDKNFADIFYNIVRNCLVHEAELTEIKFIEGNIFVSVEGQNIIFNVSLIYSLFVLICYLPCNMDRIPKGITLNMSGLKIDIDAICGKGKDIAFEKIIQSNKTTNTNR